MKKGMKVSWALKNGLKGTGTLISDEVDGMVMVAFNYPSEDEMHSVAWCKISCLTELK